MKIFKILLPIALILLTLRLFLPSIVLGYVEQKLNQIPGYQAEVKSVEINLWRGAYSLKYVSLYKTTGDIPVPFFAAKSIEFSLEWATLFHGSIVAKVITNKPIINFVIDTQSENEQLSIDQKWQEVVKSLFPLNINQLQVNDGEVTFRSFPGNPPFELKLNHLKGILSNLQNVRNLPNQLPAHFELTAQSTGDGVFRMKGKLDPLNQVPTFDIDASIKHLQIKETNNFLKHFTRLDIKNGDLTIFIELAAKGGLINGFAKPIVKNLKVEPSHLKDPIEALYKGSFQIISKVVKDVNIKADPTKVNIIGKIDQTKMNTISIVGYILRHAFINALIPQIDPTVLVQDVRYH